MPTQIRTLSGNAYIKTDYSSTINSDARIVKYVRTQTITSTLVVSYEDYSDLMEEGWDEIIEVPEFEKTITYRRFDLDEDNMTGDIDRSMYTDYTIYAEVQPTEIDDKLEKSGTLSIGDAEVFLPAKIIHNTSGDIIDSPFRPQLDDEVIWKGIRYRIWKITFERIGRIEIFADCLCKRLDNVNPTRAWNDRYDAPDGQVPGKGWS